MRTAPDRASTTQQRRRRMRRGFNLIELAVASAMAGVISIAAIGAFAHLNRQLVHTQRETSASDSAKSVVDMLVTNLQGIGGGAIRPWMAVLVEDGATPDATRDAVFTPPPDVQTDRITWATLVETAPTCAIEAIDSANVKVLASAGKCCLAGYLRGVLGLPEVPTHVTAYAINGNNHLQIVLSGINPTLCTAKWEAGPLATLDARPDDIKALIGGSLSRARIRTLYVDSQNRLQEFEQTRAFGTVSLGAGRVSLVASDVFDLQLHLGYDADGDGRVRDRTSTGDEWLYNVIGDDAPTTFRDTDLRMVGAGVVVGVRVPSSTDISSARVLGGVELTSRSAFLRAAMGRAALRNLFVFN